MQASPHLIKTSRNRYFCRGLVLIVLVGLGSFLLAHIAYIFSYRQLRSNAPPPDVAGVQKARLSFPVILTGTGLVIMLYPGLGDLKLPVTIYAIVLTTMVLASISRYGRTSAKSFWLVFCGSALFMLSDAMLAIDRFLNPIALAGLKVMITYCVAQFLIVQGIIASKDK